MVRWIFRVAALFGLSAALSSCVFQGSDGPQSVLHPAGPVAQEQIDLFLWTYYLSWIVVVAVGGVLIYSALRFRRRPGDDSIPPQVHGNTTLEIAWTAIPVLLVIAVAIPTVRTLWRTEAFAEPKEQDIVVNVTGHQWWWRFEYPELGIVTANELHVPVGRRVILNMTSADVLHSFWPMKLAGKRDLIPNQNNQLWFIADESGVYLGQCAELCLGAHAYMRFRVIAEEEADFEIWKGKFQDLQVQQVQADPLIEQGRLLFTQKGCATCHTIDGYAEDYSIGKPNFPDLTNFGLRLTVPAGWADNTPENLAAWLRDPQEIKPGNRMPTLWAESDPNREEEIDALVAYLLSLGRDDQQQAQASVQHLGVGGNHGSR
ncbi:MAG: cytochrome c oxidase subunit II [Trueperaceae bacterium]|nr:MAG: cytochrome c oxidase subunit II [Trueperaceae bacterium]